MMKKVVEEVKRRLMVIKRRVMIILKEHIIPKTTNTSMLRLKSRISSNILRDTSLMKWNWILH
jgi:hypothetical protein